MVGKRECLGWDKERRGKGDEKREGLGWEKGQELREGKWIRVEKTGKVRVGKRRKG
jgi:hypothetical protein